MADTGFRVGGAAPETAEIYAVRRGANMFLTLKLDPEAWAGNFLKT